jgi:hypothetical protein
MRLSSFPFVIVRIGCSQCKRRGSYRLARLAEAHGAETDVRKVLHRLTLDCPWREDERQRRDGKSRCFAAFVDLEKPTPPDLPPAMAGLRVIKGGREDAA